MKTVTILRKWSDPKIEIHVTSESIQLSMSLDDFITALAGEVAEPAIQQVAQDAGNPTLLFTNAQLEKRMVASLEGAAMHAIFVEATNRIIEAVKAESNKLM